MLKRNLNSPVGISILLLSAATFAACGSSGGGGGTESLSYTGKTTKAVITADNASDIAVSAFSANSLGSGMSDITAAGAVVSGDTSGPAVSTGVLPLARALADYFGREDFSSTDEELAIGVFITDQGSCGGTASYNYTGDAANYTVTMNFTNYCQDDSLDTDKLYTGGAVWSGSISANVSKIDPVLKMDMTANNLSISYGSDSVTSQGTIGLAKNSDTQISTLTLNLVFQDNITGTQAKIEDYVMTLDASLDPETATIEPGSKFYDSRYGYVDMVTLADLWIDSSTDEFISGIIELAGAEDKTIRLTLIDADSCRIEADLGPDDSDGDPDDRYDDGDDYGPECFDWSGETILCPVS